MFRSLKKTTAFTVSLLLFSGISWAQETTNEAFIQPSTEALLKGEAFDAPLKDFEFYPIPEVSTDDFKSLGFDAENLDETIIEPMLPEETLARQAVPADVSKFPYSAGGALFFKRNNKNYRCSAQFTADPTVLLTAAHCVRDTGSGTWNSRTVFYRAYEGGTGDFYSTQCIGTKQGWVSGSNKYKWDYAFIKVVGSSRRGGVLGYKTGTPYSRFESIGYAGNCGGGKSMYKASGRKGSVSDGIVQMLDNPCTFGHSGGAWIGANRYAIGTNSFIYRNRPNEMYGPVFDGNTTNLFNYVKRGCR